MFVCAQVLYHISLSNYPLRDEAFFCALAVREGKERERERGRGVQHHTCLKALYVPGIMTVTRPGQLAGDPRVHAKVLEAKILSIIISVIFFNIFENWIKMI